MMIELVLDCASNEFLERGKRQTRRGSRVDAYFARRGVVLSSQFVLAPVAQVSETDR